MYNMLQPPRKVIHTSVSHDSTDNFRIVATCDDGSMWMFYSDSSQGWNRFDDLPKDEDTDESVCGGVPTTGS